MLNTDSPELVRASFETTDKCVGLWSSGNRDAALERLLAAFEENSRCGDDWAWLAATWQLRLGRPDADAIETLRRFPSYVPE